MIVKNIRHVGLTINNEYRFPLELFNKLEPDYSLPEKMISSNEFVVLS